LTQDVKSVHQFHLENFFEAVRANDKKLLTCPAEEAYVATVSVFKMCDALQSGEKRLFPGDGFRV